ncbi:hypothetical protein Ancab_040053 [Ancistrocladus abbreviatus]
MKLLSLNCRGLGCAFKRKEIRKLVRKERVEAIFLQETKLDKVDRSICRNIWGDDNFDWAAKLSVGKAGGLICIWNSGIFKVDSMEVSAHVIWLSGCWGQEQIRINFCNIYSPCQYAEKRNLWEDLTVAMEQEQGKWCLIGDFNSI